MYILIETLDECPFLTRHLTKVDCDNCSDRNKICPGLGNILNKVEFKDRRELIKACIKLAFEIKEELNEKDNN